MQKMIQIALDWQKIFPYIHNLCTIYVDRSFYKYSIILQMKLVFIGKFFILFLQNKKWIYLKLIDTFRSHISHTNIF